MQLAAELAKEGAPLVGEGRPEACRGIERVGDRQELLGFEAAAARRSIRRVVASSNNAMSSEFSSRRRGEVMGQG